MQPLKLQPMKADKNTEIFKTNTSYNDCESQISTSDIDLFLQVELIKQLIKDFEKALKNVPNDERDDLVKLHWATVKSVINFNN